MNNEPMSAADIISKVFTNIDKASVENTNALFNAWRETVKKVNVYGEKLVAHTKIIDLKNSTLLVETDHPGWSQILQMNENFIIRGLNWKVPELAVKNLMIRLEGSGANFYDVKTREKENASYSQTAHASESVFTGEKYSTFMEKSASSKNSLAGETISANRMTSDNEKISSDDKKSSSSKTDYAKKLPQEILAKFENMKKNFSEKV